MAKRTTPRSEATDGQAASVSRPKSRRSRAGDQRADDPGAQPEALNPSEPAPSTAMAADPSDEDIRRRAYQRYLQRGGGHGMDFEDWLQAERELKQNK